MLRDLDIPDEDGEANNNNPQSENESLASAGSNSQQSVHKPLARAQKPDVEKTMMPSRFNHRIYRVYVRGKTDQAKKLIEVSFLDQFICFTQKSQIGPKFFDGL
jgi:hypothetical protein